ncbi:MAG: D-alanine--D-alanine ligase [Planctomycetota bacterium]
MHVLILFDAPGPGARADELDGVVQAHAVADALAQLGHDATLRGVGLDLASLCRALESDQPDLVFNLVESLGGHGRLIHVVPALLEALRVPFTGADGRAMALSSDKRAAKAVLRAAGLPTPDERSLAELRAATTPLPGRWILKSVHEHASIGLDEDSVLPGDDVARLAHELERRQPTLGGEGFAERFIDGREFNLALLDTGARGAAPSALPPAEILFEGYDAAKPKVVGWRAKWDESSYEYHHTPRRFDFPPADAALLSELSALARAAWAAFDLSGWARVDFRVDDVTGRPTILEVNANPCLAPDAGFAAALARGGLDLPRALERILAVAGQSNPR